MGTDYHLPTIRCLRHPSPSFDDAMEKSWAAQYRDDGNGGVRILSDRVFIGLRSYYPNHTTSNTGHSQFVRSSVATLSQPSALVSVQVAVLLEDVYVTPSIHV